MDFAVSVHFCTQVTRKGVYARYPNAVETTGNLVTVFVEFTTGTDFGHDHLKGRDALLFVDADGNATAVVFYANAVGFGDGDVDCVAMPGQRLVNGVVNDLIHQVVQAANAHISNVHGGAHAHVFHALEGLDIGCVVFRGTWGGFLIFFRHGFSFNLVQTRPAGLDFKNNTKHPQTLRFPAVNMRSFPQESALSSQAGRGG